MQKKARFNAGKILVLIILILLLVFFVWGLIGGQEAKKPGVTCDTGIGDDNLLCWKWHKNILGQVQEGLEDIFGNK